MESNEQDFYPRSDPPTNVEESTKVGNYANPALVINIQTWATPIIGIVMLVAGLLLGYFGRPLISTNPSSAGVVSGNNAEPTMVAANPSSTEVASNEGSPVSTPTLMEFLIGQTNHFKGNPDAPVTVIEFSDYQ